MKGIIKKFTTLYKNVKFLSSNSLQNLYKDIVDTSVYYNSNANIKLPKILTSEETLDLLLSSNKSLIRFGDGEYSIIDGSDIPCQRYDKVLSGRLYDILKTNDTKFFIGINREYYYPRYNPLLNDTQLNFSLFRVPYYRKILNKIINYDTIYCNSTITAIGQDRLGEGYYVKFKRLWHNKDLLIVTNKNMLTKLKFNIFDNASNIKYLYIPSTNAWNKYIYIII